MDELYLLVSDLLFLLKKNVLCCAGIIFLKVSIPGFLFLSILYNISNQNWFSYQHTIKVSSQAFVCIAYYLQYVGNIVNEYNHSLPNNININLYCNPDVDLEVWYSYTEESIGEHEWQWLVSAKISSPKISFLKIYRGECTILNRESEIIF